MTVYNGEPYLRATLASITGQTYEHFKLIVIDDGSRDGTWETLSGVAANDSRVRLLRNDHNLGVPRSMNRLFGLASGPYVTRHDGDDVSHAERFARQVAHLESNPTIGVLGTRVQPVDADDQPLDLALFTPKFSNDEIQQELLRDNCLCQGSVMFRRHLLDTVGNYDEDNIGSEDYDLWLRMAEVTQCAILNDILYFYRIHLASLSHRRRHEQAFHGARALEQAVQRRFGSSAPPERLAYVAQHYLQAAVAAHQSGDVAATQGYVGRALEVYPQVFNSDEPLASRLLPQITAIGTAESVQFIYLLFDEWLPPTRARRRLKSRWLAEIHMQAVFRDHQHMVSTELRRHLWQGIQNRPVWLLNRGVLALLLKPRRAQLQQTQDG